MEYCRRSAVTRLQSLFVSPGRRLSRRANTGLLLLTFSHLPFRSLLSKLHGRQPQSDASHHVYVAESMHRQSAPACIQLYACVARDCVCSVGCSFMAAVTVFLALILLRAATGGRNVGRIGVRKLRERAPSCVEARFEGAGGRERESGYRYALLRIG